MSVVNRASDVVSRGHRGSADPQGRTTITSHYPGKVPCGQVSSAQLNIGTCRWSLVSQSSKKLQWIDLMIWYKDANPSNGHRGNMPNQATMITSEYVWNWFSVKQNIGQHTLVLFYDMIQHKKILHITQPNWSSLLFTTRSTAVGMGAIYPEYSGEHYIINRPIS